MTVLVIAPHPDDEILGCGGVIAKRAEAGDDVWVCIMSEGKRPMYSKEFIKEEFREMQIAHSNVGVGHFIRVALPTARLDTIPQYKLNGILTVISIDCIVCVCDYSFFLHGRFRCLLRY